jgi:hypothetical protein
MKYLLLLLTFAAFLPAQSVPVETSVCELVRNPKPFHGKWIRVRAKIETGFEKSVLIDAGPCVVWLAWGDSPSAEGTESVPIYSFEDLKRQDSLDWQPVFSPPPIAILNDKSFKQVSRYLSKQQRPSDGGYCIDCPQYEVTATVEGRFLYKPRAGGLRAFRSRKPAKVWVSSGGFGHLNMFDEQVVLHSVSNVVARKLPTPTPAK